MSLVRIPSVPPHIDYFGFVSVEFLGKGTGELVGMYRSGKVRRRRNVKEKPTIRSKLGFDLVTASLGHRARDV